MKKLFILLLNICIVSFISCNLQAGSKKTIENIDKYNIMFYNVENYFDTTDDPDTRDEEYTPKGKRYWNNGRMYDKNSRVGKVILNAGGWDIPILVGLCEVENKSIGEMLTKSSPLKDKNYGYLHQESQDNRGIDVMLLYRKDYYTPISTSFFPVEVPNNTNFRSRDILYSKGELGGDTLHVFINHWPSKYGGAVRTIPLREAAARTLKKRTDSIMVTDPMAKIIIMGDLNDAAHEQSVSQALGAIRYNENLADDALVNLSWPLIDAGKGTHKYQGKWDVIDHIIVSKSVFEGDGLKTTQNGMKIVDLDFLLEKDDRNTGLQPFRTYRGYTYHDGYSDHLPVILEIKK